MQDPIADMLTRIRNAQAVAKEAVAIPYSTIKSNIAQVLKEEGYINDFCVEKSKEENDKTPAEMLVISLKYSQGVPVISNLKRVSKPSLRVYMGAKKLPKIQNGLGIAVISTSKGIMADHKARKLGEGGEVLMYVS